MTSSGVEYQAVHEERLRSDLQRCGSHLAHYLRKVEGPHWAVFFEYEPSVGWPLLHHGRRNDRPTLIDNSGVTAVLRLGLPTEEPLFPMAHYRDLEGFEG